MANIYNIFAIVFPFLSHYKVESAYPSIRSILSAVILVFTTIFFAFSSYDYRL